MTKFNRLCIALSMLAALMLLSLYSAEAAVVIIGKKPKSHPAELQRCEALVAGKVSLGTDPAGGAKNTAFNDLINPAGPTLVFTMDDGTVPAGVCTTDNSGDVWAAALCNQKNLAAINRKVEPLGGGAEHWFTFQCTKNGRVDRHSVWVVVECP